MSEPTYLGDAVYADRDEHGDIELTTRDGLSVTNRIVMDQDVYAELTEWATGVAPSAADEKMRQSLRQIAYRCTRQEKDRAITEREQVLAWLDAIYLGQVSSDIRRLISQGAHLPGNKLPPEDPKAMLTCKAAGLPPSMRCPSCKAYHGLGLDAETGEAEIERGERPVATTGERLLARCAGLNCKTVMGMIEPATEWHTRPRTPYWFCSWECRCTIETQPKPPTPKRAG